MWQYVATAFLPTFAKPCHIATKIPAMACKTNKFRYNPRLVRARSSAGEHYVDIVGVAGSIPAAPTIHPLVFQRR